MPERGHGTAQLSRVDLRPQMTREGTRVSTDYLRPIIHGLSPTYYHRLSLTHYSPIISDLLSPIISDLLFTDYLRHDGGCGRDIGVARVLNECALPRKEKRRARTRSTAGSSSRGASSPPCAGAHVPGPARAHMVPSGTRLYEEKGVLNGYSSTRVPLWDSLVFGRLDMGFANVRAGTRVLTVLASGVGARD